MLENAYHKIYHYKTIKTLFLYISFSFHYTIGRRYLKKHLIFCYTGKYFNGKVDELADRNSDRTKWKSRMNSIYFWVSLYIPSSHSGGCCKKSYKKLKVCYSKRKEELCSYTFRWKMPKFSIFFLSLSFRDWQSSKAQAEWQKKYTMTNGLLVFDFYLQCKILVDFFL